VAACALASGAALWTLNARDFRDIPNLALYLLATPPPCHNPGALPDAGRHRQRPVERRRERRLGAPH
jgi:hypothetical protein